MKGTNNRLLPIEEGSTERGTMSEKTITVNGRRLPFSSEETILDVARRNGIFIPTLCHLKGATPSGACRVCLVEIEGARALSPACSLPASDNMIVRTDTPEVLEARRTVIALLLKSGNHNCAAGEKSPEQWTQFQQRAARYDGTTELCPAHGACKLQALAYRYQVDTQGLVRIPPKYSAEMASPLIVRDFSRCILCGRCVDACNVIQVNNAISHGFRGARAKIVAMGDDPLARSDCVFCGECIQACPVAGLVETKSRYKLRPWEARHVRTTCYYCGVGCQLDLHIKEDRIMKVTGVEEAPPNLGRLCVKGRFGYDFLHSPHRLTRPMIRNGGGLQETTWGEALDLVARNMKETAAAHGPEAVAAVCSAKSTNEALYLMQKLFRTAVGTNNLSSLGAGTGLNGPLEEIEKAACIVLFNSDVTEENPVAGTFIKRAVGKGCKLIAVDSRPTRIERFSALSLLPKEGTESILAHGIIHQLSERGRGCSEETREIAAHYPLDLVARTTGLRTEDIAAAAEILDRDGPALLIYGPRGGASVEALVRLRELLGNGGGLNYLGQLNNSQGACDMGMLPGYLPGYAPISDGEARRSFEAFWDCPLSGKAGLGFGDFKNSIRFLYCAGLSFAMAGPVDPRTAEALQSADFLVVQDILDHEMLKHADVVLPVAAWVEEEGTYTNCERRISRVRKAVPCPGEAKPETWIFTELAGRLGRNWPDRTSREIWDREIVELVPQLRGLTYDRLEEGGVPWHATLTQPTDDALLQGRMPIIVSPSDLSLGDHHRTLLDHCPGLTESLARSGGIGIHVPPSNAKEVTERVIRLLEEEGKEKARDSIDEILAAHRNVRGGLIPVLQQVQEQIGFLPVPLQNYIALGLGIPPSDVFGVVTFYSFFTMVPRGRHTIRLCLGTACFVKGSGALLDSLGRHLRIGIGQTTKDREFSLDVVRCLGACGLAPVMVVDGITHGEMDRSKILDVVEGYRGLGTQKPE
jgi:formate dehydrogenase major subunit